MSDPIAYEASHSPEPEYAAGKGSKSKVSIVVLNCEDPDTAVEQARAETEASIVQDGVTLVRNRFTPKRKSDQIYVVEVDYAEEDADDEKNNERPEPGTWHFSFDGQQGTHTLQQSLETISKTSYTEMGEPAPEMNQVIGWDGEEVRGCEIIVPSFEFTITAYYEPPLPLSTALFWAALRGRVNEDWWLGRAPGEFLYLGPSGSGDIPTVAGQRVKPIEVNHKFAFSPNLVDIPIGTAITVPSKKGWEHLWVYYRKTTDGTHLLPKPTFAYVEKVYKTSTFGLVFPEIAGSDPTPP